jgi:hypothetical protein
VNAVVIVADLPMAPAHRVDEIVYAEKGCLGLHTRDLIIIQVSWVSMSYRFDERCV